ncbi:SUN domain-containing protein 1 isoform X3 [Latimeria chalumnae]|uniref:SUN domain-containing protein 1 isoform X3 n=1 Tax=Latimeria chalumnae TaxID=7897 RepID=UPI0003C1A9A6|nr:PREDICTED: SUN domain-containing protein 1 isoform X3 [Latimeria chalumnae]|eukprot:XP_005997026.1 PREDICTED: SUN domain-containing protein 1 isoform X3 [Latimeria chalumnae]
MDFSRLHTYAPPQYVPENTGYTYALSSSYSSDALDFEVKHQIDPVYDSPRMSRRGLRLVTTGYYTTEDAFNDSITSSSSHTGNISSYKEKSSKSVRQHRTASNQSAVTHLTSRKATSSSSFLSQSSFHSHASGMSMVSTVLDESAIQERTEVGHIWGLDDDGDDGLQKGGGDATVIKANGGMLLTESQSTLNGYKCNDCSMLSERKDVLTAQSTPYMASSVVYSRDRQKHKSRGVHVYLNRILHLPKYAATSLASLFVQLFQTVLWKSDFESKAHSCYCGSMNVKQFIDGDGHLTLNGESLCDDCKGMKHLENYTAVHAQSTKSRRVARTFWHIISYAGYFLLQAVQSVGSAGWFVTRKVLAVLWLAIVSPGKAASGAFWWLGTGWYQLITLMSLFNVFLLTRCLPKVCKLFLFLIPLLLLLVGLWYLNPSTLLSLLPVFNRTEVQKVPPLDEPIASFGAQQIYSGSGPPPESSTEFFDFSRMTELEKQMALLSDRCQQSGQQYDAQYSRIMLLLEKLQQQVAQTDDQERMSVLISTLVNQHLKEVKLGGMDLTQNDFMAWHQDHESRIRELEELLRKLSVRSEEVSMDLKMAKASTTSENDEQNRHLLAEVNRLDLEFNRIKSELLAVQSLKTTCEKIDTIHETVDAQVKESVKMFVFGDKQYDVPESILEWLSTQCVSKNDFQSVLQDLEMRILKNITLYRAEFKQMPTAEVVTGAITNVGITGITEEQARVIVKNALNLYSQDKTGMVDFAMESGGGSILSTRCSETYETKTALMSLFGIPLWYFSQSPRVVIQPDIHPGNCWAFKGSQGYLVVRLSLLIYPTAFTLEHIPKALSPTGNISSAPKDFTVYGLEDEYQEEGKLLGQYTYNEEGESLQTFYVLEETDKAYQIVELRILSNWGHPEYTCVYRFRVHGNPLKK